MIDEKRKLNFLFLNQRIKLNDPIENTVSGKLCSKEINERL
jgi:hypothetical protein